MARSINQTVYTFAELSSDVQAKVINYFRDELNINTSHDWWDSVYDEFIHRAKEVGFIVESEGINFSGFYSQGDGASFVCELDLDTLGLSKELQSTLENYGVKRRSHNYYHYNTCSVYYNVWKATDEQRDLLSEFFEKVAGLRVGLCIELYKALQNEYEYQQSDEAIKETIEANDYEFYADGTIFSQK